MDAILDNAKRAQGGSSNALKKLNLDILEDPQLSAKSTKNTTATLIQTQFETVTRVRYAAHQFNLNTPEECAEYLQSILVFIASYKYNQRLRFIPKKENVLRCMGTLAEQWHLWFKTVNDIQREGICNELCNLLARGRGHQRAVRGGRADETTC